MAVLMAVLLVYGMSGGLTDVAINAQAVRVERGYRRPIINSFHACFSFGGLLGALLGGLFAWAGIGPAADVRGGRRAIGRASPCWPGAGCCAAPRPATRPRDRHARAPAGEGAGQGPAGQPRGAAGYGRPGQAARAAWARTGRGGARRRG